MKKIFECARVLFISFECMYAIILTYLVINHSAYFAHVGRLVRSEKDVKNWVPGLLIALCGFVFSLAWRLTTPLSGSNRELYQWNDYWKIVIRRNISLLISVLMAMLTGAMWMLSAEFTDLRYGYITLLSLGTSLINMGCISFATFKIKEIMD